MEKYLKDFLCSEINTQALYEEILNFILSPHIRNGEFECNEYIIKKIDQLNYIIYAEYTYPNNAVKDISKVFCICRNDLIDNINAEAVRKGLDVSKFKDFKTKFPLDSYYN